MYIFYFQKKIRILPIKAIEIETRRKRLLFLCRYRYSYLEINASIRVMARSNFLALLLVLLPLHTVLENCFFVAVATADGEPVDESDNKASRQVHTYATTIDTMSLSVLRTLRAWRVLRDWFYAVCPCIP